MQQSNYLGANKKRLIELIIILGLILLGFVVFLILKVFKLESQLKQLSSVEIESNESGFGYSKGAQKTTGLDDKVISSGPILSEVSSGRDVIISGNVGIQDAISRAENMVKLLERSDYNIAVCNSFDGIDKHNCIYTIAVVKGNDVLCRLIPSSSWLHEECLDQIERDKRAFPDDLDICIGGSISDTYSCISNWIYTNIPSSKSSCDELERFLETQSSLLLQEGINYENLLKDCKQIEKEVQQTN